MWKLKTSLAALGLSGLLALSAAPAAALTCGQFSVEPALSCQGGSGQTDNSDDVGTLYPPSDWTQIDKDEKLVGDPGAEVPWLEALIRETVGGVPLDRERFEAGDWAEAIASCGRREPAWPVDTDGAAVAAGRFVSFAATCGRR